MTTAEKKRRHSVGPGPGREFRRFATEGGLEVRNDSAGDGIVLTGMAIRYNVAYSVNDLFGTFSETMKPGVANNVVAQGSDTRFLIDHAGMPLARTISGTLKLDTANPRGLGVEAHLDARSQQANDLAVAIERGDVSQMSCGFVVGRDTWHDDETRTIHELAELFDVSSVTYPASPTTTIELAQRSLMAHPLESQARIRQMWQQIDGDLSKLPTQTARRMKDALAALRTADAATARTASVGDDMASAELSAAEKELAEMQAEAARFKQIALDRDLRMLREQQAALHRAGERYRR